MKIRRLQIRNFRGIKELDWVIPADRKLICIIGKGDSGKTTLIEAMSWLLSDRASVPVDVLDFNDSDSSIEIEAALTDLPDQLMTVDQLGLCLSGLRDGQELISTPENDCEPCIRIKLSISSNLEPKWAIVKDDLDEDKPCSVATRRMLGVGKIGERIDSHLRWTRSSALGRITRGSDDAHTALVEATLAAKVALESVQLSEEFESALESVKAAAQGYGAAEFDGLRPGIDLSSSSTYGGVSLYSGNVPLSKYGLGTRRLASLAVQKVSAWDKGTLLIDEIESGLEPHRLCGLIDALGNDSSIDQVFFTTHSSVAVEYCDAKSLAVIRSMNGRCKPEFLPDELEHLHRSSPSPFLARRVFIPEGKTEAGLLASYFSHADKEARMHGEPTTAAKGFSICDSGNGSTGGGSRACAIAQQFATLGYEAVLLVDGDDTTIERKLQDAEESGVVVKRWPSGWSTERAVFESLDKEGIGRLMTFVSSDDYPDHKRVETSLVEAGAEDYLCYGCAEQWGALDLGAMRQRLTEVSSGSEWFKSFPRAKALGDWLFSKCSSDPTFGNSVFVKTFDESVV